VLSYVFGANIPVEIELDIRINRRINCHLDINWLRKIVDKALSVSGLKSPVELSVVITSDQAIKKLNKKYRDLNETTDVLSFALTETSVSEVAQFLTPPDGIIHLGEIAISYPQAIKQSEQENHSVENEMALLLVHGVLHLTGYDHDEPQREKIMKSLESQILEDL
jgi:probable rRNA maturation factor